MKTKTIDIQLRLISANERRQANLRGFAYLDSGLLAGDIENTQHPLSPRQLVLVTAFTFTGCPIAARTPVPQINPWVKTNGEYVGLRSLRVGGLMAKSKISSRALADSIQMELEIDLKGEIPDLVSIGQPFQEHIRQREQGVFEGTFEICFLQRSGEAVPARAVSEYRLSVSEDFPPVWRNITIVNSQGVDRFSQLEQIDMFANHPDAKKDLSEKCRVFSAGLRNCTVIA